MEDTNNFHMTLIRSEYETFYTLKSSIRPPEGLFSVGDSRAGRKEMRAYLQIKK